jgi:hypothetical protein
MGQNGSPWLNLVLNPSCYGRCLVCRRGGDKGMYHTPPIIIIIIIIIIITSTRWVMHG